MYSAKDVSERMALAAVTGRSWKGKEYGEGAGAGACVGADSGAGSGAGAGAVCAEGPSSAAAFDAAVARAHTTRANEIER